MEGFKYLNGAPIIPPDHRAEPSLEKSEEGIIPRAIKSLFAKIEALREQGDKKITVSCSYIQLYNEKIYDLLNSDTYKRRLLKKKLGTSIGVMDGVPGLRMKWTPTEDVVIENLFSFDCPSPEDALLLFWKGLKNKMMASHRLNSASSRSHCILTLSLH